MLSSYFARHPFVALALSARGGDLFRAPDGFALYGPGDETPLQFENPTKEDWQNLSKALKESSHVAVFANAKPALRKLLSAGVTVARPVCLRTNGKILGHEEHEDLGFASDLRGACLRAESWVQRAETLFPEVKASGQAKVARLENLVLPAFADLEHRGLPIDVERWGALVQEADGKAKQAKAEFFVAVGDAVQRDLFGVPDLRLDSDAEVKIVWEPEWTPARMSQEAKAKLKWTG